MTTMPHAKYCGERCARKYQRRRSYLIRQARQRNGHHSSREWYERVEQFNYTCFWCGANLEDANKLLNCAKDHLVPLAKGGSDNISNIVPACHTCNHAKGDMMPSEFAAKISEKSSFTSIYQEEARRAAIHLVEDLAERKSMHRALGLPMKRRLA